MSKPCASNSNAPSICPYLQYSSSTCKKAVSVVAVVAVLSTMTFGSYKAFKYLKNRYLASKKEEQVAEQAENANEQPQQ